MLDVGLPSQPVRIIGFKTLPKAGDPVICVESEEIAEELVARREASGMSTDTSRPDAPSASQLDIQIHGMRSRDSGRVQRVYDRHADILGESDGGQVTSGPDKLRIPVVIKADADGSLAAVTEALISLGKNSSKNVIVDLLSKGIGAVTANDIRMAKEGNAVIFVFGSNPQAFMDQATSNLAETEDVVVHSNNIIYSLLDEAKEVLGTYLPKIPVELVHGHATVQAIFEIDGEDGKESIAGLRVAEGNLYKAKAPTSNQKKATMTSCHYRVIRNGVQVCPPPGPDGDLHASPIQASSLRKFKELVDSVRRGDECGLGLEGYHDFEKGDKIECYSIELKSASL
jgi:translation initiation factor IF-2